MDIPTPGPYHVARNHAKGAPPEHDTFSVLAPNPDAGKQGVPYAGEHLSVAQQMDDEAAAHLFAASPEMRDACAHLLRYDALASDPGAELEAGEALDLAIKSARTAVAKADERTETVEES